MLMLVETGQTKTALFYTSHGTDEDLATPTWQRYSISSERQLNLAI
jgi:hypothetical protein